MSIDNLDKDFFENIRGKKILVTGHTGFKGAWLAIWLDAIGADVIGYSLENQNESSIFKLARLEKRIKHYVGDIRDQEKLGHVFKVMRPDAVVHLAAQALVQESYKAPHNTFEVNTMGTLNILEQIRNSKSCNAGIIITSDKCYENREMISGYRETDLLGGADIYSSSKACTELLVKAYRHSFFELSEYDKHNKLLITARAGNVIGGGDWADFRIVPDCIRALLKNEKIVIRNQNAIRPWQHVLEPLFGYMMLLNRALKKDKSSSGAWNFGPNFENIIPVIKLVEKIFSRWGHGKCLTECDASNYGYESSFLNLDSSKAKQYLKWYPIWDIDQTVQKTVEWYKAYKQTDVYTLCLNQINNYCNDIYFK